MDKPNSTLPPIPGGLKLWPEVTPVRVTVDAHRRMAVRINPFSERSIQDAIAHGVHSKMRTAGEWLARAEQGGTTHCNSNDCKTYSRMDQEHASELLSFYKAIYTPPGYEGSSLLAPDDLKKGAENSFRAGLRDGRQQDLVKPDPKFNDTLFAQVAPGASKISSLGGPKL